MPTTTTNCPDPITEIRLNLALIELISNIDKNNKLTFKTKIFITNSLSNFAIDAIKKYIKGQIEHGGCLYKSKRDMIEEIKNETIDLFWYQTAEKYKRKEKSFKHKKSKVKYAYKG